VKALAWGEGGFRHLVTKEKEVRVPQDFKGMKIRCMETESYIATYGALGTNAVPMAWSETITGLQQGTIDGEENPYMNIVGNNMQEVQKYVIETNHIGHIITFFMNYNLYQGLPEDVRVLVDECAEEATAYANSKADESIAEYKKTCEDAGCEIIVLDDKVMGELKEKASMVYDMVRENTGDELVDQLLAAINEAK